MKIQKVFFFAASFFCTAHALAQYKYTGPDGRVVYSDTPPPASVKGVQKTAIAPATAPAGGASNLPYALQQASRISPVTLFTAPGCAACDAGRAFLTKRGIPFTEKTIKSNEDVQVLTKISGATSIPVLTVGPNKHSGFEAVAWGEALDSAGYPQTSQLPPGYKPPPATSAAPPEKPAPTAQAQPKPVEAEAPPAPPAPPAGDPGNRPAWFKGF